MSLRTYWLIIALLPIFFSIPGLLLVVNLALDKKTNMGADFWVLNFFSIYFLVGMMGYLPVLIYSIIKKWNIEPSRAWQYIKSVPVLVAVINSAVLPLFFGRDIIFMVMIFVFSLIIGYLYLFLAKILLWALKGNLVKY